LHTFCHWALFARNLKAKPDPGPSEIEIRPIFEMADFGGSMTLEVAQLHDRNREKTANR
jgi:hypothetical protein